MTTMTAHADPAEMRRVAARMEEENPWWIVVFGVFTQEFVAFPRFRAPVAIVTASYPGALPPRMRRVERAACLPPHAPATETRDADAVTFRLAG